MTKKKIAPPFSVGDKVTTTYFEDESRIVRTVTMVSADDSFETGYGVLADQGDPCPCCGRAWSAVPLVASSWFERAEP